MMSPETMDAVIHILERSRIPTADITGGAPELHPRIQHLITGIGDLGKKMIFRSNLTALLLTRKGALLDLLKKYRVEIVASLPCYTEENVDAQRGEGVFRDSMKALRELNDTGYGMEGTGLTLNLVYNPLGPSLPGGQEDLESDYKREMKTRYGVSFNRLLTITNMPIGRFRDQLMAQDAYDGYYDLLKRNFNQSTLPNLMCRKMLSVSWDGRIFDCDFNQVLDITVNHGAPRRLADFNLEKLRDRQIEVGDHCFACTAGRGSSCGGELKSG